ncbi:Clavaminate synthase-like protein [Tothia fuscella]|uniref:Clavaminate synthase-like protein n=1 Tax=Tothia fuscella TaxID=1048955 RepID=A0A9P4U2R0_9PEZI|nr:Clavaminate synthase-like protein [Tothia fuscella]
MEIPILNLSLAKDPTTRPQLLKDLYDATFNIGFVYIKNHSVPNFTIDNLTDFLPKLFDLPNSSKSTLSKINSPHFVGYNGYAEEKTLGKQDLREQFDFATELDVVYDENAQVEGGSGRDFSKLYWRLRGPNLWPDEGDLPGFRRVFEEYHDALSKLSFEFVELVEEAFGIPKDTFKDFFVPKQQVSNGQKSKSYLPPQHRIKLLKYPATSNPSGQGVGPHKDSSGWLTFLYQVGTEPGLEVLTKTNTWIPVPPIPGTFVVNFGNAFEAATEGAVRATVHKVKAPVERDRYSIPFFMGLPLDLRVSDIRACMPESVRRKRGEVEGDSKGEEVEISKFLDGRWDCLGESQLRKWIRSHEDVGRKWYVDEACIHVKSLPQRERKLGCPSRHPESFSQKDASPPKPNEMIKLFDLAILHSTKRV